MTITNVGLRLSETARQDPNGIAIAMPRGRDAAGKRRYETLTFKQLDEDTDRIADGLAWMGVPRGARLVLMVPPSIDFIALTFALFKAGMTTVLIDPGMGRKNLVQCLTDVEPDGIIGIPLVHAIRSVLRHRFPKAVHNITVGRRWFWGGRTLTQLRSRPVESFQAARGRPKECCTATATSPARPTKSATFTTFSLGRSTCRAFRCLPCSTARWG